MRTRITTSITLMLLCFIITGSTVAQNIQDSRKYRVIAYKNGNNSITSMSNTVEVVPFMSIYIPNSFTPNGDGMNDQFGAYGEAIKEYRLQVFNRWGQMVFESDQVTKQWDGTYDGVKVPQGTYVYTLSAKGTTGGHAKKDGTVTVVY